MTTARARARGKHQRKVDEVDIRSPTAWLHHDASVALRLRVDAQNNLQLLEQLSDSTRHPIHDQFDNDLVAVLAGVSHYNTSSAAAAAAAAVAGTAPVDRDDDTDTADGTAKRVTESNRYTRIYRNKALRAVVGGEVLPWGAWPVRLRNHDGQMFYGSHGSNPPLTMSGTEDVVHDGLRRWDADEQYRSVADGHHEEKVTRLFPGTHGGWVKPATAAAAVAVAAITDGDTASIKAITPPRGSVEQEDERPQKHPRTRSSSIRGGQTTSGAAGAAAEYCAVSPAVTAADDGSTPTRSSGGSDYSTDDSLTAAATGRRPPQGGRKYPRSLRWQQQGDDDRDRVEGEEGGKRKGAAGVEGTPSGGSDDSGRESSDGGERRTWHGWTVSEPAKEAVRRVWGRARRRARDSFEPSHRSSPRHPTGSTTGSFVRPDGGGGLDGRVAEGSSDDDESTIGEGGLEEEGGVVDGSSPGVGYPAGRAIRETLDPVLLSCLGRECEGIIDAALHVVLGDRLRRVASPSGTAGEDNRSVHQGSPSPLPPLPVANWEDVLKTMWTCSSTARKHEDNTAVGGGDGAAAAAAGGVQVGGGGRIGVGGGDSGVAEVKGGKGKGRAAAARREEDGARGRRRAWGTGDLSDGAVVVVNDRLPGLPLNEAVLTRSYNRLLLSLHEKKPWGVSRCP